MSSQSEQAWANPPLTPLQVALDDVRRKLDRQTMRFLGDSVQEQDGHQTSPRTSTCRQRPVPVRRLRCGRRRAPVCCIRVRSPSVNILLQPTHSSDESARNAGGEEMIAGRKFRSVRHLDTKTEGEGRSEISPTEPKQCLQRRTSDEGLHPYVRRKVSRILRQVAVSIAQLERASERRTAGANPQQQLFAQISRVAVYTAACRQLKHALSLYVVAGRGSKTARRSSTRYRRFECPRRIPSGEQQAVLNRHDTTDNACLLFSRAVIPSTSDSRSVVRTSLPRKRHIMDLPKGVLLSVFSYLTQWELSVCAAPVCKAWHRLARNRCFWRELYFDAGRNTCSAESLCNLLEVTPGLWTLELIGWRDVDIVLAQACVSCRKLRTLVLDSCTVSPQLLSAVSSAQLAPNPVDAAPGFASVGRRDAGSVLEAVLEQCPCLQYLIVAFTPHLYSKDFFSLLGRRCWGMQCFLVSADEEDVREFCESLSAETPGFAGSQVLLGSRLGGSWIGGTPQLADKVSTGCRVAHPPRERDIPRLRRKVTTVRTRNNLLRVLALRPDSELRLLQWRMGEHHATLDYFGVEARLDFSTL